MAIPKRRVMAITVGVWLAAAGSAAALSHELSRPFIEGKVAPVLLPAATTLQAPPGANPGDANLADTAYLPALPAAAQGPHRPLPSPSLAKGGRDISAMDCADWRDLDMGSGRVQFCQ